MSLPEDPQSWSRPGFLISTDKSLLSIPSINDAFDMDIIYWTKPVPDDILQKIINNSFCFGLYEINTQINGTGESNGHIPPKENLKQIGFARLVGDQITFAYFTDLYVLPGYQGLGLGGWLIDCIGDVIGKLPYLRWAMLRTSLVESQRAYEKRLGMSVLQSGDIELGPVMMGKKGVAGGP